MQPGNSVASDTSPRRDEARAEEYPLP